MDDLETAIKIHIQNERRWIRPENNLIIMSYNAELHIKTIEQAPKGSKSLENIITKKKVEIKAASDRNTTDNLSIEIQALKRLYGIVITYVPGEPLDGLAY
jgi:hypothetical protein